MNVLLSAYACEPDKGSEPEAGFRIVRAAAQAADRVTLITRANNVNALAGHLPSNVRVVGWDLGRAWLRLKSSTGATQAYYWAWQRSLGPIVRQLHAADPFDLVHHATFAVDWMPVGAQLPDVPLVWGPVGGVSGMPWNMIGTIGTTGVPRELLRNVITGALRRHYGRRLAAKASLVVAQNYDECRHWEGVARRVVVRPNVVVPAQADTVPSNEMPRTRRTAIFVGRLIPLKGGIWAVRALATPMASGWDLEIVGEGPEKKRLQREAERLGLQDRVRFRGWLPRQEVLELMSSADAMIAPSVYEGAGYAVAEAITAGCPVIATRRGGLEVLVQPEYGQLVELNNDLDRAIGEALDRTKARYTGTTRWSEARFDEDLRAWYATALAQ